jgi:predicted CXXCH cytochrome family protein
MLLVTSGALVVSCNELERHKVLTFFFDGVTPLGREGLKGEPIESAPQRPEQGSPAQLWYVHGPQEDCTLCHGSRRGLSPQTRLAAWMPKLCYECHTDYTVSAAFVHGPVAVGQCLLCHNWHRTKIEHHLKGPEPKLCYQCHDIDAIESIPAHFTEQPSACADCHDAHASSERALLTETASQRSKEPAAANAIGAAAQDHIQVANEQKPSERAETTRTTELESKSSAQVFRMVGKLIERGELQEAKAYLEKFKGSSIFTDEERGKIPQVLRLIDSAIIRAEERSGEQKLEDRAAKPEKSNTQRDKQKKENVELYYHSMTLYRTGQLVKAREGFVKVLKSGFIPAAMVKTIRGYMLDIDNTLAKKAMPPNGER